MTWELIAREAAPVGMGTTATLGPDRRWYIEHEGRAMRWNGGPGFGQALPNPNNLPVVTAAAAVMDYFHSNPCTRASVGVVSDFQRAYNAAGLPGQLTVDGQYGGNTQRALDNTIGWAAQNSPGWTGPLEAAPPNCFGMAEPGVPAVDAGPTTVVVNPTPVSPSVTVVNPPTDWNKVVLVGALVAGAGLVGYALFKQHKKGGRAARTTTYRRRYRPARRRYA